MLHAISRLAVRVAIVAASLAWVGFVFANTIGNPGRGERVAAAVLADDEARAEVVAPISATVVRTAGLPADRRPAVEVQVDALLRDPESARTFVDPFAGQWARMLGADDARPARYDVGPILDEVLGATQRAGTDTDVGAAAAGADAAATTTDAATDEVLVPGVPLPQARLDWLVPSHRTVTRATGVLASIAAVGFVVGFAIGNRRWVLRRMGVWAASAGAFWVLTPIVLVWAARRWATGADAVIAVALDEATSGLLPTALALLVGGVAAFVGSFLWVPALSGADRPAERPAPVAARRRRQVVEQFESSPVPAHDPGPGTVAARRRMADLATSRTTRIAVVGANVPPGGVSTTAEMPVTEPPAEVSVPVAGDDDPLWNFYTGESASRW